MLSIYENSTLQLAAQFCATMSSRGEIVKKVVVESGFTISRLAARLGISRTQLYADFTNPEMSFDRILAIGRILHHDFSKDFKELPDTLVELFNGTPAPTASQLQECQSKVVALQDRLIDALDTIARYREKYGPEPA
jgi:hypothetical protein